MQVKITRLWMITGLIILAISLMSVLNVQAVPLAQIPTGSVPTVTGPVISATILVLDNEQGFANVRSGPGTLGYEIIGVLVEGQQAQALGRTVVGDWILIAYPSVPGGVAWIWKDLVEVSGTIPIVSLPPTSTPRVTPTIDPTLAAQFLIAVEPTKLPTFTPAEPLVLPTFSMVEGQSGGTRVPTGLIIVGAAVLGIFGLLISFLRGR